MANPDLSDLLKTESLFPHRHGEPQGALMALEPIPRNPGGSLRELDIVKDDEQVGKVGLVEKPGERREVGLMSGKDHKKCLK